MKRVAAVVFCGLWLLAAARARQDPYFRGAAERALRAVQSCAPYRLPADRYEVWREIEFRFNPSRILR